MNARALLMGIVVVLVWTRVATAEGPPRSDDAGDHPLEFRVGAFRIAGMRYRPELCIAGSPWSWLSFEACGTGAGIIHDDPIPEIAHFRAKLRLGALPLNIGRLQWFGAVGFGELQLAEDAPGFEFRRAHRRTATSGPEAGIGLRLVSAQSRDLDLLLDAHFTLGWFPHAVDLAPAKSPLQPSGSFTMGVGF